MALGRRLLFPSLAEQSRFESCKGFNIFFRMSVVIEHLQKPRFICFKEDKITKDGEKNIDLPYGVYVIPIIL